MRAARDNVLAVGAVLAAIGTDFVLYDERKDVLQRILVAQVDLRDGARRTEVNIANINQSNLWNPACRTFEQEADLAFFRIPRPLPVC